MPDFESGVAGASPAAETTLRGGVTANTSRSGREDSGFESQPRNQSKLCQACRIEKRLDAFNKNKARKDGLQNRCRVCQKAYHKAYYTKRKPSHYFLDKNKRNAKSKRQFIFDYLREKECVDCGEDDPIVLEFDHLHDKEFNLSAARNFSIDRIKKEIAKCDVVCRNCHARRTANQFGWYQDLNT